MVSSRIEIRSTARREGAIVRSQGGLAARAPLDQADANESLVMRRALICRE
jgi:hypothetical protein